MSVEFYYPFIFGGKSTQPFLSSIEEYKGVYGEFLTKLKKGCYPQLDFPKSLKSEMSNLKVHLKNIPFEVKNIVVLGIGGSSLGISAMYNYLYGQMPVVGAPLPIGQKKHLWVVELPTDDCINRIIEELDLGSTLFLTISKSGSTLETISGYIALWDRIISLKGANYIKDHFIMITDPENSLLKDISRNNHSLVLYIPPHIGGRYSAISSAVGLSILVLLGLDPEIILDAACTVLKKCYNNPIETQIPFILGSSLYVLDTQTNKHTWALFGYGDHLTGPLLWLRQLLSESLGKHSKGITPLIVHGPQDQHSILQLFEDGPDDKQYTFFSCWPKSKSKSYIFDHIPKELDPFVFLKGKTLNDVLDALSKSTYLSLAQGKKPVSWINIDASDLGSLGAFFLLMEVMTIYMGMLYGVNPFDQPAVEKSKKLCKGFLGSHRFEEDRKRALDLWKENDSLKINISI